MIRKSASMLLVALSLASGCATVGLPEPSWPTFGAANYPPGSPEWWKKNKKKAEYVPNHGLQVAGTPGYFDQKGRPIASRVAKQIGDDDKGGLLDGIQLAGAVEDLKSQVGLGKDEQIARDALAAGDELFRQEKYSKAAARFKEVSARWPDSQLEQDAMFRLAECYFFAEKYAKANDAYEALVQKYSNTPHLDKLIRRQFEIAQYWEQLNRKNPDWPVTPNFIDKRRPLFDTVGRAIKAYDNIRLNDPTGPLADDAVMATANSFFVRGRFRDADYYYTLLRNEYPRSEHQYEAHVLGLQCKLRKYGGPDYIGTPLEEAQKLSRQLRTQFASELDDTQRTRLAEIDAQLNRQLALRISSMAEYYEGKHEYGAAKRYHRDLIAKYPTSELATKANERLIALGDKPDVPAPPLQAVIGLFPENAERAAIAQVPMVERGSQIQVAGREEPVQMSGTDAQATQRR
ncbi:tetratricopeptide repeat protein [Pirellulales bacterium]|nr:tetratricopeptide repeat protein [Pirellulales bacterium]